MNKYLHYYGPVLIGTLFGFVLGYGYRFKEVKVLKNIKPNLIEQIDNNIISGFTIEDISDIKQEEL